MRSVVVAACCTRRAASAKTAPLWPGNLGKEVAVVIECDGDGGGGGGGGGDRGEAASAKTPALWPRDKWAVVMAVVWAAVNGGAVGAGGCGGGGDGDRKQERIRERVSVKTAAVWPGHSKAPSRRKRHRVGLGTLPSTRGWAAAMAGRWAGDLSTRASEAPSRKSGMLSGWASSRKASTC